MDDITTGVSALLTISLFVGGIYINRNYKKADEIDIKVDGVKEVQAVHDQRLSDMLERLVRTEETHKAIAEANATGMQITRESLHAAATRATDTFARRDDMHKVLEKIDSMPERMESRFRAILADREAQKK